MLVGINLLREGLDLPEVSLVAILDADKEGFLRSTDALIQTIGRAARHVNGTAILYADTVTGSMRRALDETERRRAKQRTYNQIHGIEPRTIRKAVVDVMERGDPGSSAASVAAEHPDDDPRLTPAQLDKILKKLEKEMARHARDLEFEQAAAVRDRIKRLKARVLSLAEPRKLNARA